MELQGCGAVAVHGFHELSAGLHQSSPMEKIGNEAHEIRLISKQYFQ